jgi:peptidoglycan/xylan/chitin deacetylase (PgdA/CDA1 family)
MMKPPPTDMTIALMYHAVGVVGGPGVDPHYAVASSMFTAHLQACVRAGGAVACTQDWLDGRGGVIVTFDDGHESNHRVAWPALAAIGGRADFFVNPAQVGTAGFATWAALREMADAGMSIQSHGLDHGHYLTELSPARLREELRQARLEIESHTGHPVTLLAPPGGRCPRGLDRVAREVGYTHVLSSRPAAVRRDHRATLGRFAVTARLDVPTLEAWLRGGAARLKMQARYLVLDAAKRTLGDRTYERVRRGLLAKASP